MSKNKNYYDDPEYRLRHLKYMNEKIECPHGCGSITARNNMHHHRRTNKCQNYVLKK